MNKILKTACVASLAGLISFLPGLAAGEIKWTSNVFPVQVNNKNSAAEVCQGVLNFLEKDSGYVYGYQITGVPVSDCSGSNSARCIILKTHETYGPWEHNSAINANGSCAEEEKFNSDSCTCEPVEDPCDNIANPVQPGTGRKIQHEVDFVSADAFPLQVARTYRSGAEGGKWYFSGIRRVASQGTISETQRSIIFRRGDGSALYFIGDNTHGYVPASPESSYSAERTPSGDSELWTLVSSSGEMEEYDEDGYLIIHTLPNGLQQTYAYVWDSPVSTITITDEATGDQLVYTLDDDASAEMDPVTSIELPDSSMLAYTYMEEWPGTSTNGNGLLETVTYPAVDSVSAVKTYRYADNDGNGSASSTERNTYKTFLTGILEDGVQYANWRYDSSKRAIWSEHGSPGSGIERTQLSYTLSSGRISSVTTTNANGLQTVRHYELVNDKNRIKEIEGQTSGSCLASNTEYTYDSYGYRDTATDTSGNVTQTLRDAQGRVEERITAQTWSSGVGSTLQITATSQREVISYEEETTLPESREYYYRNTGNSAWVHYRTIDYTYDSNNRLTSRTVTDELNSVSRVWAYTNTYHSSPDDKIPGSIVINGPLSGSGDSTTYNFNSSGQLTSVVNAASQTTAYSNYNAFGLPETMTDPNSVVTTVTYDERGRVETITADDGGIEAETVLTYYPNGLLETITQPDGSSLEYFYNSAHQLIGLENNHGDYMAYTPSVLDGQWEVQEICTAGNATSGCTGDTVAKFKRTFDALGRLSVIKDASNNPKQVFGYDSNNNLTTRVLKGDGEDTVTAHDENDIAMEMVYDALDRLVSTTNPYACNDNDCVDTYNNANETPTSPAPAETQYAYNGQGLVSSVTDAEGHVTTFGYNGFGELIEEVSPDRGTTTYAYDAAGNLITKTKAADDTDTDGGGPDTDDTLVISYSWDNLNRLTAVNYPDTDQDIAYSYDSAAGGESCGEAVGRLCRVVRGASASSGYVSDYTYDALGRVSAEKVRPTGTSGMDPLTTAYSYNDAGEITEITHHDGRITHYTLGTNTPRLTAVDFEGDEVEGSAEEIQYQPFGGIRQLVRPLEGDYTLSLLRSYDQNGRLSAMDYELDDGGTSSTLGYGYAYDAFSNIASITNSDTPHAGQQYIYDALQRLTQATGIYGRYRYTYDNVGNRLTQQLQRAPANNPTAYSEVFTDTYDYASTSNRLESVTRTQGITVLRERAFTHDGRGNIKTDERTEGATTTTLGLEYGNGDRLDGVDVDVETE